MIPTDLDAFNASLARTESGGRYGVVNSEGYTGKYQFGPARLADYVRATGDNVTMDVFRTSPDIQERVQAWHVADIDSALAPYVGTVVNGMPLTLNAIRAMAHLGGTAGARRYIETGGKYDPADSNGTRLSDYARTHGGAAQPAPRDRQEPAGRDPRRLAWAYANGKMTPEDAALYEQGVNAGELPKAKRREERTEQPDPLDAYEQIAMQRRAPQPVIPLDFGAPVPGLPTLQRYRGL